MIFLSFLLLFNIERVFILSFVTSCTPIPKDSDTIFWRFLSGIQSSIFSVALGWTFCSSTSPSPLAAVSEVIVFAVASFISEELSTDWDDRFSWDSVSSSEFSSVASALGAVVFVSSALLEGFESVLTDVPSSIFSSPEFFWTASFKILGDSVSPEVWQMPTRGSNPPAIKILSKPTETCFFILIISFPPYF